MAYARRSTKRRVSSSRYRPAARRSHTATRRKRAASKRRASARRGQTIKLVIEHSMPNDIQRPQLLTSEADKKDKNQRRTF